MATQQIKGSKRYRSSVEMTDLTKTYSVEEASALLNKLPKAKFDETVEFTLISRLILERVIRWFAAHFSFLTAAVRLCA